MTGFSPFYLLFGRSPHLPFNLDVWSPRDEPGVTHRGYAKKCQIAMTEAYLQAAKNILKQIVSRKKQYERKLSFSGLQHADRVLVRCLSDRGGPGKLRSYWEQQGHVSVGQTGNPPVFEVRPEILTGKPRVLHINLLLPFDFLQVDHPDPFANQSQGNVPSSSPSSLQNDKFGTSDSVDEDDSSGLSLTEFETLQLCTPTGDTERRGEGKAEVTSAT